jgi:hypothetical protein
MMPFGVQFALTSEVQLTHFLARAPGTVELYVQGSDE